MTRGSSQAHAELLRAIRKEFGARPGLRIFSNPRGFDDRAKATYGLAPGAGDLIAVQRLDRTVALQVLAQIEAQLPHSFAWELAVLRAALQPVGQFVSLEGKSGLAKSDTQQVRWRQMVNDMGGVGREVRSVDDARAAFNEGSK